MDHDRLSRPSRFIWNIVDDVPCGMSKPGQHSLTIRLPATEKVKFNEAAEGLLVEMKKGTAT